MKTVVCKFILTSFLFLSLGAHSSIGIGGAPGWEIVIDTYDRSQNFYYFSTDGAVAFINEKGKERKIECTSNVVFYDIDKDQSFNLFPDSFKGAITSFAFEKNYDDSLQKVIYDSSGGSFWIDEKNNFDLPQREIYEQIIITTYSFQDEKYTLWTCDRTGENLRAIDTFFYFGELSIDAFNEAFLIQKEDENGRWYIQKHSF